MNIGCLVRNGIAYISCYVKVGNGGPYHEDDAIGPIPVQNAEDLRRAFHDAILRGSPVVPESDPRAQAKSKMLKLAGVKSWTALYSNASAWKASDYGGHYRLSRMKRYYRGWTEDQDQTIHLPPGATAEDAAQRLVEMIQAAGGEP